MLLRRRLNPQLHGSAGYTSVARVAVLGLVVGFFVVASHVATQAWYNGRILPGVYVAGLDIGGMSVPVVRAKIQKSVAAYRLHLTVGGEKYDSTASALGVSYDIEATVASSYASGRSDWLPPLHHDILEMSYHLDRAQLNSFATRVAIKIGTAPVDAGLTVSAGTITSFPEKSGWSIDRLGLQRLIEADVRSSGGAVLSLQPREQLADIQVQKLAPAISETKQLMAVPIVLTYQDRLFTPTPAQIGQWIAFIKQPSGTEYKLVPQIDVAKLKSYVQGVANQVEVAAVNKKVTVENGISRTDAEGKVGLAIEQEPVIAAVTAAVNTQQPLSLAILSHPVAFKIMSTNLVSLDYGRYIEVNLSSQHLWAWQDHAVIFDSAITSGATGAGLGTVTGLFSIYYKTTNTRLRGYQYGYDYDVPVKYWMPFYQGYGLHDAAWRNGKFGGQDYYLGGSHGCVNLPDTTAEFIYNWADVGTPVWVHN